MAAPEAAAPKPKRYRSVRLFEPLELREVTSRNRIMISPMSPYSAPESVPLEWHYVHRGSRAVGGAGIVMTEAAAIEARGRISPWDVGLWNDEQETAFARIAAFVSEQGAVPGIQLAHAGRRAYHTRPWEDRKPIFPDDGGWEIVAPGPISWAEEDIVPTELTGDQIAEILERYKDSAQLAGFKIIEIHAAHGYLLHSSLSPLINQREDDYGVSLDNRIRIVLEVVGAIREVWPHELPLFMRFSVKDWVGGGWEVEHSIELAKRLAPEGIDLIDCSSGGAVPEQQIPIHPGYQAPLAHAVREGAEIKNGAMGLINEPAQAEKILANERADLIVIGRLALWSPYWPHHAASVLKVEVKLPIQYARSEIYA